MGVGWRADFSFLPTLCTLLFSMGQELVANSQTGSSRVFPAYRLVSASLQFLAARVATPVLSQDPRVRSPNAPRGFAPPRVFLSGPSLPTGYLGILAAGAPPHRFTPRTLHLAPSACRSIPTRRGEIRPRGWPNEKLKQTETVSSLESVQDLRELAASGSPPPVQRKPKDQIQYYEP